MQRFYMGLLIATLCLILSSSGVVRATSLAGKCENWMTISLADQKTGKHSESATRAGCNALRKSGDFVAEYLKGTCLVCNLSDWKPVGAIVEGVYVRVIKGVGYRKINPSKRNTIGSAVRITGSENALIKIDKKSKFVGRLGKAAYIAELKANMLKASDKSCKAPTNRRERELPPIWAVGPEIELHGPLTAAAVAGFTCANKDRYSLAPRNIICSDWTDHDVTFNELPPQCQ